VSPVWFSIYTLTVLSAITVPHIVISIGNAIDGLTCTIFISAISVPVTVISSINDCPLSRVIPSPQLSKLPVFVGMLFGLYHSS
jgi:hypothetical protein